MPSNNNGQVYQVNPVYMNNRSQVNAEIRELKKLQRGVITNYKDWAKERLKYTDIDGNPSVSVQGMKQCNDAYTASILSNCLMPYREGISIGSILSSVFTYKMARIMNPGFKQDVSRMYLNWRDSIVPSIREDGKFHPIISAFDHYCTDKSIALMHNQIQESMDSNTLDELVMTPRQLAVLKVNFMEQYYVDIRKCNVNDMGVYTEMHRCTDAYNKAIKHLNIIAANSGFDMSVVAEEERYIVGLKIKDNPNYANMFIETHSLFGVEPRIDEDGEWSGSFETLDNHAYTVGGDVTSGAFTPRLPYHAGKPEHERINDFKSDLAFFARDCAAMQCYLDNDCPCDNKTIREAESRLKSYRESFMNKQVNFLQTDFGMGEGEARKFIKQNFLRVYKDYLSSDRMPFDFSGEVNGLRTASNDCFKDEINLAVDRNMFKHYDGRFSPVFRTASVDSKDDNSINITDMERDYEARMNDLYDDIEDFVRDRYGADKLYGRSGKVILEDMRNNYVSSMTGEELFNLVRHAGNNCSQSYFSPNHIFGARVYVKNKSTDDKQSNKSKKDPSSYFNLNGNEHFDFQPEV